MLDIVPRGGAGGGGRVVRLAWKLPARLRRAVHSEKEAGRAAVSTSDIGRARSRPNYLAPPYFGAHARRWSATKRKYSQRTPLAAERQRAAPQHQARRSRAGAGSRLREKTATLVRGGSPAHSEAALVGERDIPYYFSPGADAAALHGAFVLPPQRRLPLRGVWLNAGVFLLGCLLVAGAVRQLHSVSLKAGSLVPVRELALAAFDNMVAASQALAQTDFATGERQLAEAEAALRTARVELDEVLGSAQAVLRYVDVTGTVRSGEELLDAGRLLTEAGQHVARGLSALLDRRQAPITETIALAREELGQADGQLAEAEQLLRGVDSPLLPAAVVDHVQVFMNRVPRIRAALSVFLTQSDVLLTVLGADRERQYLFLFQNNHELRPTGGFIGSVALIDVDRGVIERAAVQSVYDPDGQLKDFIAPPDPLLPITDRWYLRDSNWFVDWPVSARKAAEFFEREGGPTVDGVVAITPEVIRALLEVTGPITLPDYGVTVDADTFWVTTQHQVTYVYDREANKPKQFLADLTPRLLEELRQTESHSTLQVLSVLARMIEEKHLLVYFTDGALEDRLAAAGWAGGLPREQAGMLAVNNANIGGHKSDQFIEQEIDARYEVRHDGDVDVVLTIQRTHRGPDEAIDYGYPPEEDPARKDNIVYQRVLVPAGARLVDAQGFSRPADISRLVAPADVALTVDRDLAEWQRGQEVHASGTVIGREAGYTFFANWLVTRPGETSVATYHYRLPDHVDWPSAWDPAVSAVGYVFKQPGAERTRVRLSLRLPPEARILHAAPREGVARPSENEVLFAGELKRDVLMGAVFEAP